MKPRIFNRLIIMTLLVALTEADELQNAECRMLNVESRHQSVARASRLTSPLRLGLRRQ